VLAMDDLIWEVTRHTLLELSQRDNTQYFSSGWMLSQDSCEMTTLIWGRWKDTFRFQQVSVDFNHIRYPDSHTVSQAVRAQVIYAANELRKMHMDPFKIWVLEVLDNDRLESGGEVPEVGQETKTDR
jgi:hypothetical protein